MPDIKIGIFKKKVEDRFFGKKGKKKRKGPKVRIHRNGSVEVSVMELLQSEAGQTSFEEAHNSPLTQAWLKRHGYVANTIDLKKEL